MLINWCRRATHRVGLLLRQLVQDDAGQDLIEYALLTGIIAIAGILLFPTIQSKMASAYQDWNDSAQDDLGSPAAYVGRSQAGTRASLERSVSEMGR